MFRLFVILTTVIVYLHLYAIVAHNPFSLSLYQSSVGVQVCSYLVLGLLSVIGNIALLHTYSKRKYIRFSTLYTFMSLSISIIYLLLQIGFSSMVNVSPVVVYRFILNNADIMFIVASVVDYINYRIEILNYRKYKQYFSQQFDFDIMVGKGGM